MEVMSFVLVACPSCLAGNRVDAARVLEAPKCGGETGSAHGVNAGVGAPSSPRRGVVVQLGLGGGQGLRGAAVAADQEFREIPFDLAPQQPAALLARQIVIERMCVRPVHVDLLEQDAA